MTRLPPDSFLPSGALDHDPRLTFNPKAVPGGGVSIGDSISSNIISPLSLSRIASQQGYFDNTIMSIPAPQSGNNYIYTSRASTGGTMPTQNPQSFLSPSIQPSQYSDARSTSHSSSRRAEVSSRTASTVTSPPQNPTAGMSPAMISATSHPRSVSADAALAPSSVQMIRRLAQQNSRIREAWEAERKYMEANRERVEEVYKEERAIMEEERVSWEAEKDNLMEQLRVLKEQVAGLQDARDQLHGTVQRLELEKSGTVAGLVPLPGVRGSGARGSTDSTLSGPASRPNDQRSGGHAGARRPEGYPSAFQSASDGFSPVQTRSQFISPGSSRISPSQQPESSPFIPLIPNMQPGSAPADFLSSQLGSPKDETPVPIVDVQTIHPELEGIPLKAPAIQKNTFTDTEPSPANSKTGSRNSSPPGGPSKPKRSSSKEKTLQLFAADESDRLVMHAGHTPSHSLSFFPTAAGTEVSTVVDDSGNATPTAGHGDVIPQTTEAAEGEDPDADALSDLENPDPDGRLGERDPGPEDLELKAPLMVRNIPAQDEIFFQRLSDKLEEVSRGEDAIPTCLKDAPQDTAVAGPSNEKENILPAKALVDGAPGEPPSLTTENDQGSETQSQSDEIDIPLKLKKSSNFGAPFGAIAKRV